MPFEMMLYVKRDLFTKKNDFIIQTVAHLALKAPKVLSTVFDGVEASEFCFLNSKRNSVSR